MVCLTRPDSIDGFQAKSLFGRLVTSRFVASKSIFMFIHLQVVSMGMLPPWKAPTVRQNPWPVILAIKSAHQDPVIMALKVVFKRYNNWARRFGTTRMDRQGWQKLVSDAGLTWDQERRRGAKLYDRPHQMDDVPWSSSHNSHMVRVLRMMADVNANLFTGA